VPADAVDGGAHPAPRDDDPVSVLVVDDQPVFRRVLRDLVAATEGFDLVGEAASGEAALEAAAELSPRLVIMDKRMPGMGGIEASRVLSDRHPELVVLLISVEEAPEPSVLRSCGAAAYVRKQDLSTAVLREMWRRYAG
jgi:DNA-binding NarL/FixJ family response regulator